LPFCFILLLDYVRLQSNSMSGTLMPELGNLSPNELWLQTMPLSGTIPSELGTMLAIDDLRLSNTELEGTIPDEIYNVTTLWRLDLSGANLVGTISPKIEQLSHLGQLRISDNAFTGTLPALALVQLSSLDIVWLERNQFSGAVPSAMCQNRGLPGGLQELYADCLPSVATGAPPAMTAVIFAVTQPPTIVPPPRPTGNTEDLCILCVCVFMGSCRMLAPPYTCWLPTIYCALHLELNWIARIHTSACITY
jgi:hypothetical protein